MNRWISTLLRLAALLPLLLIGSAQAAQIQTEISRNPVALNESFDLTFSARDEVDGDPEFGPLEADFQILDQSTSQSIRIVNGSMNKDKRWTLTLMAKRAGNLKITPISFGADRSDPLPIKVMEPIANPGGDQGAADKGSELLLKLEVEPKSAYVQQQVLLKVKLFLGAKIGDANLTEPVLDDPAAPLKKLGEDRQYDAELNGRRYRVVERRYTLFPQKSGTLDISPVTFTGEVITGPVPRGMILGRPQGQVRRLQSEGASLEVKPVPAAAAKGNWLPSNNLQLLEDWPANAQMRVGEPLTRTLLVLADGLTSAQLPVLQPGLPAELKQYPDQPQVEDRETDNGITGVRQQKIAIVPTRPGEYRLPPLELTWWNTETDKPVTARLPERVLKVLPALGDASQTAPAQAVAPPVVEKAVEKPLEQEEKAPETGAAIPLAGGVWPWIALVLAVGWLGTLFGWWLSRRGSGAPVERKPAPAASAQPKPRLDQVKGACQRNDAARAGEELLRWGAARWPDQPPRSLGALARKLPAEAANAVGELERVLYAPQPAEWSGLPLWEAIRACGPDDGKGGADSNGDLSPLYPH